MTMKILINQLDGWNYLDLANTSLPKFAEDVSTWSSGTTYGNAALAKVANGSMWEIYRSLQGSNTNHIPASSPTWWEKLINFMAPKYDAGTTYSSGDRVIDTDGKYVYTSLANGNIGNTPASSPASWKYEYPNDLYVAVDGNLATKPRFFWPTPITFTFDSLYLVDFVAIFGIIGFTSIDLKILDGVTVVYSETKTISYSSSIASDLVFELPSQYINKKLQLKFYGAAAGSVAAIFYGTSMDVGTALHGSQVSIIDYSTKTANSDGSYSVTVGSFSKRVNYKVAMPTSSLNTVFNTIRSKKGTPMVFSGYVSGVDFQPLIVYGFYKEFSIDIAYPTEYICFIEVEGLSE